MWIRHRPSALLVVTAALASVSAAVLSSARQTTLHSMRINNGAETTRTDNVTIAFSMDPPATATAYVIGSANQVHTTATLSSWIPNTRRFNQIDYTLPRRGNTPILGAHTVYVKVRDANGQESNTSSATIVRVPDTPPPSGSVDYTLSGLDAHDVIRVARAKGYGFEAVTMNSSSDCAISDQSSGVWFTTSRKLNILTTSAAQCHFRLFHYKALRQGWSLKTIAVAAGAGAQGTSKFWMIKPPAAVGTNAACVAEGTAPPTNQGSIVSGYVVSVTLTGPAGTPGVEVTWRNAFQ
jgi:hypothetical protein